MPDKHRNGGLDLGYGGGKFRDLFDIYSRGSVIHDMFGF
jgi:hypothetical protein